VIDMAEIKDKVVTVESLATLHENNKDTYMTKENPVGRGSFSINRKADTIIGDYSVAEGLEVAASGYASNAEGCFTIASGAYSHVGGYKTTASGSCADAEGYETIAAGDDQHVQGRFNIVDTENKYAHIVGNGDFSARSNAHTLDWDGNAWFAGNVSMDGNIILGSHQYGDTLPTAGTVGRIFFKRLSE
jgi:hypothetical protein